MLCMSSSFLKCSLLEISHHAVRKPNEPHEEVTGRYSSRQLADSWHPAAGRWREEMSDGPTLSNHLQLVFQPGPQASWCGDMPFSLCSFWMSDPQNPWTQWKKNEVAQLCPTLCDPMDHSLPSFSVHGVFQARILEWVAISFSRGSSPPRDRTQVSSIAGRCFTLWATREAPNTVKWLFYTLNLGRFVLQQ